MTELYRCKVIENFQGKHIINNLTPTECTISESEAYFYRGKKSLKVVTSAIDSPHIIDFNKVFNSGEFKIFTVLFFAPVGFEWIMRLTVGGVPTTYTVYVTGSNIWQKKTFGLNAWQNKDIEKFEMYTNNENVTFYIQDIILYKAYHITNDEIFKIVFPQGIGAYEESWGMRFSRKQIPVAYGGIFQTTGAKGREFSISGTLHEKEQNIAGIIQPMRKLNKEIPYYMVDEGGFNNNLWYPVNITDFDIKKVPSAPYLWKFSIDMEEYTENDV